MEIRVFQIVIPLVALIMILSLFSRLRKSQVRSGESIVAIIFWVGVSLIALFPDWISRNVASIFGIKDNVNAILFVGIGTLFYFQFRLYHLYKDQQRKLTQLARLLALQEAEEKEE